MTKVKVKLNIEKNLMSDMCSYWANVKEISKFRREPIGYFYLVKFYH